MKQWTMKDYIVKYANLWRHGMQICDVTVIVAAAVVVVV